MLRELPFVFQIYVPYLDTYSVIIDTKKDFAKKRWIEREKIEPLLWLSCTRECKSMNYVTLILRISIWRTRRLLSETPRPTMIGKLLSQSSVSMFLLSICSLYPARRKQSSLPGKEGRSPETEYTPWSKNMVS